MIAALASFFFVDVLAEGRRLQTIAKEEVDRKESCETEVGQKEVGEASEERDADSKYLWKLKTIRVKKRWRRTGSKWFVLSVLETTMVHVGGRDA